MLDRNILNKTNTTQQTFKIPNQINLNNTFHTNTSHLKSSFMADQVSLGGQSKVELKKSLKQTHSADSRKSIKQLNKVPNIIDNLEEAFNHQSSQNEVLRKETSDSRERDSFLQDSIKQKMMQNTNSTGFNNIIILDPKNFLQKQAELKKQRQYISPYKMNNKKKVASGQSSPKIVTQR